MTSIESKAMDLLKRSYAELKHVSFQDYEGNVSPIMGASRRDGEN